MIRSSVDATYRGVDATYRGVDATYRGVDGTSMCLYNLKEQWRQKSQENFQKGYKICTFSAGLWVLQQPGESSLADFDNGCTHLIGKHTG